MNAHLARILKDRAAVSPKTPAPVSEPKEKKATVTPASPADTIPSPEKEN